MLDASRVQLIAFDADDTLWGNEMIFRNAEEEISNLLSEYEVPHITQREMYAVEMQNLKTYGYGIKGFALSMIEVANKVSNNKASGNLTNQILAIGKRMLIEPIDILPGVIETLQALQSRYKLIIFTKGSQR